MTALNTNIGTVFKMKTLDEKFQHAKKALDLLNRDLIKLRNSDAFQDESKETQDGVIGIMDCLKNFREKAADWPWTDVEKEDVIKLALKLSEQLFGIKVINKCSNRKTS